MSKGRWQKNFSVKSSEPKLFALVKLPNGQLVKKEVKREAETSKLHHGYVQAISGLYVPKVLEEYRQYVIKNGKRIK